MNITLSRREFTRLVELVYMGEQVSMAIDEESGSYVRRYEELVQRIYKIAAEGEEGRPEYVAEDEEIEGEYNPSMRLETDSPAANALEKYDNHIFWEEIISRLAERDMAREELRNPSAASGDPEKMMEAEIKRQEKIEDKYREEFVKSELDNVFVMFGSDRLS